jgi:hypothetical protein
MLRSSPERIRQGRRHDYNNHQVSHSQHMVVPAPDKLKSALAPARTRHKNLAGSVS